MLPDTENYEPDEIAEEDLQEEKIVDRTYFLDFERLIIGRKIDGMDAKKQAIQKVLLTESELSPVYDAGYGRMFEDLPGHPISYTLAEAKNRIQSAVLQDERFASVLFTSQHIEGRTILLGLSVICMDGEEIEIEGVSVNV